MCVIGTTVVTKGNKIVLTSKIVKKLDAVAGDIIMLNFDEDREGKFLKIRPHKDVEVSKYILSERI